MKKILFISLILIAVLACKKTKFEPEGPTDVRVRNLSNVLLNEVIVNTSEGIDTLGNIAPGEVSEYYRFKKAYYRADITAKINGVTFSTEPVDYTYLTYQGQVKLTYEVEISDLSNKVLKIKNIILEEALHLK